MKRLQNLSYKTLFTILFLGLAGIVFLVKVNNKVQKVSAAWWDDSWHHRQAISISNSSGSILTDFQVAISIGTSQLIADGKMQSDCDDIRITDINGTELPYWIEENNSGCNQITDTKIWIKANSIPTSGSTVYIYYGNSSAETISNVTTTFGPLQKLSLGASYTVTPSPSGSYSDDGGTQLTNGLVRENLYQSTEATVGWHWQNPITAIINLNKISVISSFKFYLGGGGTGGIDIPSQITTSYSLDNSTYSSIGVGGSWTNSEQWVNINNNSLVAARYGKSIITTPNEWTMVGEIEIYGYPGSSIQANTSYVIQSEETNNNHPIAAWWNDSWHHRQAISISNSSGSELTDFQVAISIGTSQLIADGKMQSDCDDIRITDINGTELPYWVDNDNFICNSSTNNTKIWIKAPSIPTSGTTIYLYYSNISASNNENPNNVFEFFDDFNDNQIKTSWKTVDADTVSGTNFSETSNQMQIVAGGADTWTSADQYASIYTPINGNFIADVKILSQTNTNGWAKAGLMIRNDMSQSTSSTGYAFMAITPSNGRAFQYDSNNNGYLDGSSNGGSSSTPIYIRLQKNNQTLTGFESFNDTTWTQRGSTTITSINSSQDIGLSVSSQSTTLATVIFDNIKVRKYASTEPTTSNQSEETGSGPIAAWKFDEGSGTIAYDSVSSNDGTITTATYTSEDQCISGKCLYFNGTDSTISVPNDVTLKPKNYISISAWIKPTDITTNTYYDIYRKEDGDDRQLLGFQGNGTILSFGISTGGSYQKLDVSINPSDFTDGNWHFVSAVYDGQHKYIYKDGKAIGSQSATGIIGTSGTANAYIGSLSGSSEWFKGYIDDFKIYPYARTSNQILQDYNSRGSLSGSAVNLGVQSNISSLVAYYKFDESIGTTAYDSSVNKNNGTLINSPTWTKLGKINKALSFDGTNDYVTIPRPVQDDFSISFWVKTTATAGTGAWYNGKGLIDGEMGGYVNDFGVVLSGSKLGFGTGGPDSTLVSNQSINNGQWRHIVVTRKKSTGQKIIYIDGSLDISGTAGTNSLTSSTDLKIGAIRELTGSGYLNGLIDEVKIYNKVLTANEVKQEYDIGSAVQFGSSNQTIGGTTTSLNYCIPGDTSYCTSPVAEWNMDQDIGTSIIDTSSNDNDGTPGTGSAAPTWIQGKIGKALNFNGGQYVTINDSTSLKPANAITVESWFYTTNKNAGQRIISKTESSGYQLSLNENSTCPNNTLCFLLNINGTYRYATYPVSSLSNNTWYHVAGTYDGSIVKLFLNGSNIGTSASASNIIKQSTYKVCIGSEVNSSGCSDSGFFYGKIDQVKIYDYARTPAQIAYDYNRGEPIGWWKMDECQGSTIYDWSGNGNNGNLLIGQNGTQASIGTCQAGTFSAWTNGATGKFNSSLNFDGTDDYVEIPNNSIFNFTSAQSFSVSTWVKVTSLPYRWMGIVTKSRDSSPWYGIWISNTNKWVFGNSISEIYGPDATLGWHHIVISQNSATNQKYLYIDTHLSGSGPATNSNGIGNLQIGRAFNSNEGFVGQIDDVRIYNYALTPEQIKQVYNGGAVNFN